MFRSIVVGGVLGFVAQFALAQEADCPTLCRVTYAKCMEDSSTIPQQETCKKNLQTCEEGCESAKSKPVALSKAFPKNFVLGPEDPELVKALGATSANDRWHCRVTWNFGWTDGTYNGKGPTEQAALGDAVRDCQWKNFAVQEWKAVCSRKPKGKSCSDSGAKNP
jgi:hypothetical protein